MFEVQVLIPNVSNDGVAFSAEHFAKFEDAILASFGGYSVLPAEIIGAWLDAGVTYRDRSRVYAIAIPSLARGAAVAEIVAFAKAHFGQLAIAIRYLGQVEII